MPNDLRDWTSAAGAPQRGLANFQAPPNTTTPNTVTISRGTHSVAVMLNSLANVNGISVTGVQTGVVYAANLINLTPFGTLFFVPVLSDFDNQITVAVTMGILAQTATVRVAEILDPEIVAIYQSNVLQIQGTGIGNAVNTDVSDRAARQVGKVQIVDVGGNAAVLGPGVQPASNALAVVQTSPQTWQIPNLSAGYSTGSLAAAGTQTIQGGGGANVRTRLFQVTISVSGIALVFGSIECPTGTIRAQWNGQSDRVHQFDFGGLDCGLNADVIIRNQSGSASGFIQGHATVNQT